MRDLSLHLLDIAENSVRAEATLISIHIEISTSQDLLTLSVIDDGFGMSPELLAKVKSPFTTTRSTRPIGLGIPMLLENARNTGGDLQIESTEGQGTTLVATFGFTHIDRPPLGDLVGTMVTLIAATPEKPEYVLEGVYDDKTFTFETKAIKEVLGPDVPLNDPEVLAWIRGSLQEEFDTILPESVEKMEGITT